MAETPKTEDPEFRERESSGLLADKLFGKAFAKNAEEHLEKAKTDLARGAEEQAGEHLKQVGLSLAQELTKTTSPRLSDGENEEWLSLQQRKYRVTKDGFMMENFLDDVSETRIQFLSRKAFGQGQK